MKKLLKTLTETSAPSGYEDALRKLIRKEIRPYADEIRVDALGNLIARKGKASRNGRRIMLAAHMDEIGVIVGHIDDYGFIRFIPVGTAFGKYIPGSRIRFLNGEEGLIGTERMEPFHETPPIDKMYIDVGSESLKETPVRIGDVAAFHRPFAEMGNRLVAKSMDDRAGVAVLIEVLRILKTSPHEIHFVFTAQEEVGARGSTTAAYSIDPEIGIAVDITPAGDTPNANQNEIRLGKGPAIKIRDPYMLSDPSVVDWMIRTAQRARIPYQREVLLSGSTDARAIQLARSGVATGALGIPCRYVHSPSEMVDYKDMENAVKLLKALVSKPIVFN